MNAFGDAMKTPLGEPCNFTQRRREEARRQMILSHFLCKAVEYCTQVSLMLIMGDISGRIQFSNAFDLLQRKRYNYILAQPKDLPMLKDISVTTAWLWDTLSVGGQALRRILKFSDDRGYKYLTMSGCAIGDDEDDEDKDGELSDEEALISGKADVISDTELSFEYSSTDSEYEEQFINREPENSVSVQ
ncbi:unnamed protein product [Brassica oleracea var. botrytis]|uniref:(rape) hypothetical protein n=1 Tax=Brassica napus TaxID=3708 RepID=A0A816JH40_BRANA|nr:unnamed protein product [Brassica napus]